MIKFLKDYVALLNSESDKETDAYIDRIYFRSVRIAGLYPNLSNRYLAVSVIQILFFVSVLVYHMDFLLRNAIFFLDINFILFSQNIHFLMLCIACLIMLLSNVFRKNEFAKLHKTMAAKYYDYEEDNASIIKQYQKELLKKKIQLLVVPLLSSGNGLAVMFISRYLDQFGRFDPAKYHINFNLPFPGQYSFPTETGTQGFYYALTGQLLCVLIMLPLIISCAGFIFITITMDYVLQLKILLYSINNIEKRAKDLYFNLNGKKLDLPEIDLHRHEGFTRCFISCLNKCVKHHHILISAFHGIQDFCGINLLSSYTIGSIMIGISANCIKLDQELPGTQLAMFSLCLNEIFYMAILSLMGQMIIDLSEDVRESFYRINWYHFDRMSKLHLRIIRESTLTPMTLMAGGMVPVNLDTFSQVMNSAYTYYNLLNASM